MNSMIEAIISDDAVFRSTTADERDIAVRWLGQRFGTHNLNYLFMNYPGMFTRLVARIRGGKLHGNRAVD